jgi:hypothetical protein
MAESGTSVEQVRELRSIARLSSATDLNNKVEKLRNSRSLLEMQWKLNLAFFKGRQYTYYNRAARKLMELPSREGEKPRHRVRLISNQISKNSLRLVAKLSKTKPQFAATPGTSDDSSIRSAEAAQALAEHWWHYLKLADKYRDALMWAVVAGSGWWLIDWDKFAGTPMTYMEAPDGHPITDDGQRQAFSAQLEQAGLDPKKFEKTVYLGDVRVRVLNPFQVFLDPTATSAADAKYAICELQLDPEEIAARWGVYLEADSVPTAADQSLPFLNGKDDSDRCTKRVFCGYFLPSPSRPDGRVVYWADDRILEDGPLPPGYGRQQLNLVKFGCIPNPGSVYDLSIVEGAIDDQKELNKTLSQITTYRNLTVNPQWMAPRGGLRDKITTESGAVFQFTPIGGMKPEPIMLPSLPPYVLELLDRISARIKEDFFLTELSEGQPIPNMEAGVALDMMQEAASDALVPIVLGQEEAIASALMVLLGLAKQYYVEPRLINITGTVGSTQVKEFMMSSIDDGTKIHVETLSSLSHSRAGRMQQIIQLTQSGILSPSDALRHLDLGSLKSLEIRFKADEDMSQREHDRLLRGEPVNQDALNQAMQALQQPDPQTGQPVNPQSGQPFQSQQEVQSFLEDASLQPFPYENYSVSLDVHGLKLKSVEYESWPPDAKRKLARHFELTLQALQSLPAQTQPAQAPRISMQFKGSLDPTTASQMLNKAGVPATPDQLQQPPLPTWISDSVDKPDDPNAFEAGHQAYMEQIQQRHDQLAQMEQQQAQMAQQGQQMANAQEAHDLKIAQQHDAHSQKMAQQAEAHHASIRAKAQAAKRPPSGKS